MDDCKFVTNNGRDYAIFKINYRNYDVPVLLDSQYFKIIKEMNKKWKCNYNGFIFCSHTYNGLTKDVYLHEIIMLLKNKEQKCKNKNNPIIHVNRIGLDNRHENLIYDTAEKDINKNCKKKTRTIELPKYSGIDPDEIPTYIWYMKSDSTHGDRFIVNIGDITWKTTSSTEVTLRYKLEEAKMFLRNLLRMRPDLYKEYCMNGDYTQEGKELLKTFYKIINLAGYDNIEEYIPENNTFKLLKSKGEYLDESEEELLNMRRNIIKGNIS